MREVLCILPKSTDLTSLPPQAGAAAELAALVEAQAQKVAEEAKLAARAVEKEGEQQREEGQEGEKAVDVGCVGQRTRVVPE